MLSPTLEETARTLRGPLLTLWCAMAAAVLFFAFLAWALVMHGPAFAQPPLTGVALGAGIALAAGFGLASLGLGARFFSPRHLDRLLCREVTATELARDPYHRTNIKELRHLQALAPHELRLYGLRWPYFSTCLGRLACAEAVALVGFVLALLAGEALLVLPFAAAALLLMALAWPDFRAVLLRASRQAVPLELQRAG